MIYLTGKLKRRQILFYKVNGYGDEAGQKAQHRFSTLVSTSQRSG